MLRKPLFSESRRRGTAAIEFAVLLPVFTFLLVAILDYGWLFFHRAALDAATNTGCRAGSLIDPGMDEAQISVVQQTAQDATITALAGLGVVCGGRCRVEAIPFGVNPARSIRCTLDYNFDPLLGGFLDPATMESLQVARLEYQR